MTPYRVKKQSDGVTPRRGLFSDAVLNEIDEKRIRELIQMSLKVGWLTQLVFFASLQQLGTSHDKSADAERINVRGGCQWLRFSVFRSDVMKILLLGSAE